MCNFESFVVFKISFIVTMQSPTHVLILHVKGEKRKTEAPVPTRVGKKRRAKGPDAANKLPAGMFVSFIL